LWITGDAFWFLANQAKLKDAYAVSMACIRWFPFRATPSFDDDGGVVKWFGTNTDIEDRKRAKCLLAGEDLVLEMTAKGSSLESSKLHAELLNPPNAGGQRH
jgi:hypothetical protein